MGKSVTVLKTLIANSSMALAVLLLAIIAVYSSVLLVQGMPFNSVSESQGEPTVREIVYHPYPAAVIPLLGSLVFLLGLLIRKFALAWLGLAVLLVFSLLFLFSSGAALLPVASALLVLLTVIQFTRRGAQTSSFLFPGLVLLAGLVVAGYYYLPALTPGQAARPFTWDMLFQDQPVSRMVPFEQDTAVILSAHLEDPEGVSIDYAVVARQGWGWQNLSGGGLTTGRYSGDPAVLETVGPERGLASPFTYGYLLIQDVRTVEAVLSSGERREDRPEYGLFLLAYDLQSPPCRLQFLDAAGELIDIVDLTDPAQRWALPGELMGTARQRCAQLERTASAAANTAGPEGTQAPGIVVTPTPSPALALPAEKQTATLQTTEAGSDTEIVLTIRNDQPYSGRAGDLKPDWLAWGAQAFTVAPDGSFWIADSAAEPPRLLHYNLNGELLRTVSLEGLVVGLADVEADEAHVWVLGIASIPPKILQFAPDGTYQASFDLPESIRPVGLSGIALAEDGALLVEKGGRALLYRFIDPSGKIDVQPLRGYTFKGIIYAVINDHLSPSGNPIESTVLQPGHSFAGLRLIGVAQDTSFYVVVSEMAAGAEVNVDRFVQHYKTSGDRLGVALLPKTEIYAEHDLVLGPDGQVYFLASQPDHSVQIQRLRFAPWPFSS